MDTKEGADNFRKKKTRRKKRTKCIPASEHTVEGTPFKDTPINGLSIKTPVLLDLKELEAVQEVDLCHEIFQVDVGVEFKSAVSNLEPMMLEFKKMLKQHKRLRIYKKIIFQQLGSAFPNIDCSEVYPTKSVRRIINACRQQSFSLSSMVHGLKVSHILWLQKAAPSNSSRLYVLACLVMWLLRYVQAILRELFHIALHTSNERIFYDKRKWMKREHDEISLLVKSKKIFKVEEGSTEFMKLKVIGRSRFLIKPHGLRPITTFKKPKLSTERAKACMLLRQMAHLNGCMNTPFSGSIDQVLQNSLIRIKESFSTEEFLPEFYFVRADVKDAFGSISHFKLLSVLQELKNKFLSKEYKLNVRKVLRGDKVEHMFESGKLPLPRFVKSLPGSTECVDARPILDHVRLHVHRLGTCFGKSTYGIHRGIPQGMHLSCILCELYYNSLDNNHLQTFLKTEKGEIFLRFCDDYLFITPSKDRADQFLKKISFGFRDYEVVFNASKTVSNLETVDLSFVDFCGFTINLQTFCVKSNFNSYKNQNVAHTLNLEKTRHLGKLLLTRAKLVLKLYPLLVDKRLNSKHIAAENIYGAGLLMAFRIFAFVNACFPIDKRNQSHILKCIKLGEKCLRRRVLKITGEKLGEGKWLSHDEIKWLVFQAFFARFKNAVWCSKILKYLKGTCKAISCRLKPPQLNLLKTASSPPLPGIFLTMK